MSHTSYSMDPVSLGPTQMCIHTSAALIHTKIKENPKNACQDRESRADRLLRPCARSQAHCWHSTHHIHRSGTKYSRAEAIGGPYNCRSQLDVRRVRTISPQSRCVRGSARPCVDLVPVFEHRAAAPTPPGGGTAARSLRYHDHTTP